MAHQEGKEDIPDEENADSSVELDRGEIEVRFQAGQSRSGDVVSNGASAKQSFYTLRKTPDADGNGIPHRSM